MDDGLRAMKERDAEIGDADNVFEYLIDVDTSDTAKEARRRVDKCLANAVRSSVESYAEYTHTAIEVAEAVVGHALSKILREIYR